MKAGLGASPPTYVSYNSVAPCWTEKQSVICLEPCIALSLAFFPAGEVPAVAERTSQSEEGQVMQSRGASGVPSHNSMGRSAHGYSAAVCGHAADHRRTGSLQLQHANL